MNTVESVIGIFASIVIVVAVVSIATNENARASLQLILDTYYKSLSLAVR